MQRPGGAEFAPNAFVYPGGSVHAEDSAYEDVHRAAAVRELFEEVGILLARRHRGGFARAAECEALRAELGDGGSFLAALERLGLRPAFDRLAPLARWVTPEALRRRFDTRFYVARLPAGQDVHPQEGEVVGWRWVVPAHALTDPSLVMVHATRRILESVAGEDDFSRLVRKLRRRVPPEPVRPRVVQTGGRFEIVEERRRRGGAQRQRSR